MVKLDLRKKSPDRESTISRLEAHQKKMKKLMKNGIDDETEIFGKALIGLIDRYLKEEVTSNESSAN